MRKVVHKMFFIWDFENEERWINEMAAHGYNLVSVGFARYEFEEGNPNEYIYRLEMLKHFPSHYESQEYIRFVEETGAEHVGSFKNWVFFRKKASDGEFNMHSDIDSKVMHINKIMKLTYFCAFLCGLGYLTTISYLIAYHGIIPLEEIILAFGFPLVMTIAMSIFLVRGYIKLLGLKKRLINERNLHE